MKYLFAYRNIALPANAITLLIGYQVATSNSITATALWMWVKVVTSLALITYIHLFKSTIVFFFMNLGIGRVRLYMSMLLIDLVLFITLVGLVALIR